MRGFLGTAAALVFAFSLITAIYSLTESQPGLSGAARAGLAIESARWAVEAETFDCSMSGDTTFNGAVFSGSQGIGYPLVEVNGNTSSISNYDAGPVSISLDLVRNYAPRGYLSIVTTPKPESWLFLSLCDTDGDALYYEYYKNSVVVGSGVLSPSNPTPSPQLLPPPSGTPLVYSAKISDAAMNDGYTPSINYP